MHRVDADGYTTVGGDRRHEDQSLPGTQGTLLAQLWKNAVQEEIAHCIEGAGLTLAASGAADETADWQQLYTAIFNNQSIDTAAITDSAITSAKIGTGQVTDAKINTMSGSKIISAIILNKTVGSDEFDLYHNWEYLTQSRVNTGITYRTRVDADKVLIIQTGSNSEAELNLFGLKVEGDPSLITEVKSSLVSTTQDDGSTTNKQSRMDPDAVVAKRRAIGGTATLLSTTVNAYGINYNGSDDNSTSAFKSYDIRKTAREFGGTPVWSAPDAAGNCFPDITIDAGIPSTAKILGVTASYTDSNASPQKRVVPVSIDYTATNSISVIFQTGTPGTAAAKPDSDVVVYIEYNASGIVTTP